LNTAKIYHCCTLSTQQPPQATAVLHKIVHKNTENDAISSLVANIHTAIVTSSDSAVGNNASITA